MTTAFVSPAGQDTALGTRELPFRTLGRAIAVETVTRVEIASGEYPEDVVAIARKGLVLAGPDHGDARFLGRFALSADDVAIRHIAISSGIAIDRAKKVRLEASSIDARGRDAAIAIRFSAAVLNGLVVQCGPEACIDIASSTVTIRKSRLVASETTKRGLVVETSSVTAREIEIGGTTVNQLLAKRGARAHILDGRFDRATGTAIAAVQGASLKADRVAITRSNRFGLLVETSRVIFRASSIGATGGTAIGIAGGDVDLVDASLEPATEGGISVSNHAGQAPTVRIAGGTIRHGARVGILLAQGDLTVQGTRFVGAGGGGLDGEDAIIASSPEALLNVAGATIEDSSGFGISFNNNAAGTVTATITKPRLGGVMIQGTAGAAITVSKTRIDGCRSGSGIVVQDATEVRILSTTVRGCTEAGVLAGQGGNVEVQGSRVVDNAQYGLAAFGGAVIEVSATRAKGSRWATFASCGDGARIDDGGGNRFEGQTTVCP